MGKQMFWLSTIPATQHPSQIRQWLFPSGSEAPVELLHTDHFIINCSALGVSLGHGLPYLQESCESAPVANYFPILPKIPSLRLYFGG